VDQSPEPNVEGFPLHDSLDKISPNNPVVLTHASGHASFVNGAAMKAAGSPRTRKNPTGGEILKDKAGNPTGLLRERASGLVGPAQALYNSKAHRRPTAPPSSVRRSTLPSTKASPRASRRFRTPALPSAPSTTLKAMADKNELRMRIWMMLRAPNDQLATRLDRYRMTGDYFTVRGIKRAIDGALGPRGAWLLAPYDDKPDSSGLNTDDPPTSARPPNSPSKHGYQLCVTPSATCAIAKRSTSSKRPSKPIPKKRTSGGASSTRSTSTPPTSRASANSV